MIIEDKLSTCQAGFVDSAAAPDVRCRARPCSIFSPILSRIAGTFLVHDDGFRVRSWSYAEVTAAAEAFPNPGGHGIAPDDKVVVWGENRPEWIVAFWGTCCAAPSWCPSTTGPRPSSSARSPTSSRPGWCWSAKRSTCRRARRARPFRCGGWPASPGCRAGHGEARPPTPAGIPFTPTRDTVVEIIFTSGATADPKGVVITHRNILANIVPIEREMQKYRRYARPFIRCGS